MAVKLRVFVTLAVVTLAASVSNKLAECDIKEGNCVQNEAVLGSGLLAVQHASSKRTSLVEEDGSLRQRTAFEQESVDAPPPQPEHQSGTDCPTLPHDCNVFAQSCGVTHDFDQSWPGFLCGWPSLQDGFTGCCLAADHSEAFCAELTNEAILPHKNHTFPGRESNRLCREVRRLSEAHFEWKGDVEAIEVEVALVESAETGRLAKRLANFVVQSPSLSSYFTAGATVAVGGLLQTNNKAAAVAMVLGAISTHLQKCDASRDRRPAPTTTTVSS